MFQANPSLSTMKAAKDKEGWAFHSVWEQLSTARLKGKAFHLDCGLNHFDNGRMAAWPASARTWEEQILPRSEIISPRKVTNRHHMAPWQSGAVHQFYKAEEFCAILLIKLWTFWTILQSHCWICWRTISVEVCNTNLISKWCKMQAYLHEKLDSAAKRRAALGLAEFKAFWRTRMDQI